MMISKDNLRLESSVAAIQREKQLRVENFFRDLSLLGVAFIMLGGMGGHLLKDVSETTQKEEK